eukprot:64752-Chlamydomonas_euryale.AAC.8
MAADAACCGTGLNVPADSSAACAVVGSGTPPPSETSSVGGASHFASHFAAQVSVNIGLCCVHRTQSSCGVRHGGA